AEIPVLERLASSHEVVAFSGNVNVRELPEPSATQTRTISPEQGLTAIHRDATEQLNELFPSLVFTLHPDYPLPVIINGDSFETSNTIWVPVLRDDSVIEIEAL